MRSCAISLLYSEKKKYQKVNREKPFAEYIHHSTLTQSGTPLTYTMLIVGTHQYWEFLRHSISMLINHRMR